MNHPEELLAEYVGGALAEGERAALERHLASCARCRSEVALARAAHAALAGLPEVDAPEDLGARAIDHAQGGAARAPGSRSGTPGWYRWGGVAAGIAAALLLLVIVLPNVGSRGREAAVPAAASGSGAAGGSSPTTARPATAIESQDVNYDAKSVSAIADSYRGGVYGLNAAPTAEGNQPVASDADTFGAASGCLQRASAGAPGELVHLIKARYEGIPAYVGVYLVGSGAGQPADSVRVVVVPLGACSTILTSAAAKL